MEQVLVGEYIPNDKQLEFDFSVDVNQQQIIEDLSLEILFMQEDADRMKSYIRQQQHVIQTLWSRINGKDD